MGAPKNVLTINFGGIGDEILFLPALRDLRAALPQAKITLLLEPRSRSFEQVTNLIDATITFDIKKRPLLPGDLWQLLCLIRQGKYDLVISSGASPQVAALLFLSGIPVRVGYGANALAKLLLTHPVPLQRDQYAGKMYHDLLQGLKTYLKEKNETAQAEAISTGQTAQIPVIVVKDESKAAMQKLLAEQLPGSGTAGSAAVKFVLIHPGTSAMAVQKGIIKGWPVENWLALIEKICGADDGKQSGEAPFPLHVVLAGGPDDKEVIAALEASLDSKGKRPANFVSFAGLTRGLSDLAGLIDLSEAVVCVDSAPMHLAVGLNKKTVALFGPTEPEKLIPESRRYKVLADRPGDCGVPATESPRSMLDGLGVRLPPDIVYRSLLDLLKAE
jgi:ADP-heptose:LPS heptosyltransferase